MNIEEAEESSDDQLNGEDNDNQRKIMESSKYKSTVTLSQRNEELERRHQVPGIIEGKTFGSGSCHQSPNK